MDPLHHDLVLAMTSHLPHLIAYTIVGTATELEEDVQAEVVKFSAGGFRDFTRIAATKPDFWRDVFLTNREAVLEMLDRFTEDLSALRRAVRRSDADAIMARLARTQHVREDVIALGQDTEWRRVTAGRPDRPRSQRPECEHGSLPGKIARFAAMSWPENEESLEERRTRWRAQYAESDAAGGD